MGVVESLTAWGVVRAAEVVELAAATGLDVACAATLLEKESRGGLNIWGHDAVPTGGTYAKGGPVTRENYLAYRRALTDGTAKANGVGPAQLTYRGFQDAADQLGGCWDWRSNVRVGFSVLAGYIRGGTIRDGFRRYNGSGAAADVYAADALARLARWQVRLGPTSSPPAAAPTPAAPPPPAAVVLEDPMAPIPLYVRPDGRFFASVMVETPPASRVAAAAWITWASTWGDTSFVVTALDASGNVLPGGRKEGVAANNRSDFLPLPPGTVLATVEGHIVGPAAVPAAALVTKPLPA